MSCQGTQALGDGSTLDANGDGFKRGEPTVGVVRRPPFGMRDHDGIHIYRFPAGCQEPFSGTTGLN